MSSDPKHAWLFFANVRRFAFRQDSHKRIISKTLLLFRLQRSLVLNDPRRDENQIGIPHPSLVIRGRLNNGINFPPEVVPFWNNSERTLLCSSYHYVRVFLAHLSTFVTIIWEWTMIMHWIETKVAKKIV